MFRRIFLISIIAAAMANQASAQAVKVFLVANVGATAYTFDGGANNATLTLTRGKTYQFNWAPAAAHPFFLDSTGLNNNAATHLGLADGVNEQTNLLTFAVPATAPSTLFYQCALHNAMSGTLLIVDPAPAVPALGTAAIISLAVLVLAAGYIARRRRGHNAV